MRLAFLLCVLAVSLPAEELIRELHLTDLTITEGSLPAEEAAWNASVANGEALTEGTGAGRVLLVRLPAPAELRGVLAVYVDDDPFKPAQRVAFTVPLAKLQAAPDAVAAFRTAKREFCAIQLGAEGSRSSQVLPEGADLGTRAWWSLQRTRAGAAGEAAVPNGNRRDRELDETIDLFTGITALRENLQFDRTLRIRGEGESNVLITDLPQLEVKEVPWERMPGAESKFELDALAERLPGDQHAVLFPSFTAMSGGLARVDSLLAGPLQAVSGRSDDAGSMQRYQHQLGLELTELSKRFGAQIVDQVAMTGSDPFLRTGTDVAVLLRAKQPELLAAFLTAKVEAMIKAGATAIQGSAGTLAWRGAKRDDRSVSCYLLIDGEVAVVANSLVQIEAYAAVRAGTRPALSAAPEYAYFRRRYHTGDDELALAVVPDAALRRWCSAHWRIGDSRRMRAATVLAALQAEWIADGAKPGWQPVTPPTELGALSAGSEGLRSAVYGSLAFLTPVSELVIDRVTNDEAEAYRRFHDQYQRAWRDYLDPLAVHLTGSADGRLGVDLSILPLIIDSDYRRMLEFAGEATLEAGAGDPHPALLQLAVALDRDSGPLGEVNRDAGRTLGGLASPFGWVGQTASIYADADPFWDEVAAIPEMHDRMEFLQANLSRLPLGINVAVADPFRLAAFLTALRAMATQSAPGLMEWGTRTWKEVDYVIITPAARAGLGLGKDTHLYYLPAPEGLTVTCSEAVMQRAIERLVAARAAGAVKPAPWPGSHLALAADPAALRMAASLAGESGVQGWMQRRAWANLAILNEWRRRFPGEDPVAVHQRLWGVRLTSPAGGTYVWNERWLSMESSVFGLPAEPKAGAELPSGLDGIARITAGLSFEALPAADLKPGEDDEPGQSHGLRVTLTVEPKPAAK